MFVALAENPWDTNRGFVVPRDHVAAAAWINHQHWLTDPTVPPGQRNAGVDQARIHAPKFEGYENRWDLLEAPASEARVRLPAEFRAWALEQRVGLPPGHPWQRELPEW